MDQGASKARLITLGWRQWVALAAGLCMVAIAVTLMLERDVVETLYRLDVGGYEQKLGFRIGRVKGFARGPAVAMWGIASVTPGGIMDQAGLRSGDVVFSRHGYAFADLRWAIEEAERGRPACMVVINAESARAGSGREVCLQPR